jgi:hypothetical protein
MFENKLKYGNILGMSGFSIICVKSVVTCFIYYDLRDEFVCEIEMLGMLIGKCLQGIELNVAEVHGNRTHPGRF